MRDYGVVSPQFWIGKTGKALRGNAPAQLLALYLMTSPHANMIGVFHCPVLYMAHETGLGIEGASEALKSLIEADFCTFEAESETVFVHRMAAYQIGESLQPKDNRVKGVEREFSNIVSDGIKAKFHAMYSVAFHLPESTPKSSPLQAPCKPLASQEQEQEQEQELDPSPPARADAPAAPTSKGSRLPADWTLPDGWKTWAESARPDLDIAVVADSFRDFWVAKPGKDGRKLDWQATWRNWCRSQKAAHSAPRRTDSKEVGRYV